jgi:hypothetical protein
MFKKHSSSIDWNLWGDCIRLSVKITLIRDDCCMTSIYLTTSVACWCHICNERIFIFKFMLNYESRTMMFKKHSSSIDWNLWGDCNWLSTRTIIIFWVYSSASFGKSCIVSLIFLYEVYIFNQDCTLMFKKHSSSIDWNLWGDCNWLSVKITLIRDDCCMTSIFLTTSVACWCHICNERSLAYVSFD